MARSCGWRRRTWAGRALSSSERRSEETGGPVRPEHKDDPYRPPGAILEPRRSFEGWKGKVVLALSLLWQGLLTLPIVIVLMLPMIRPLARFFGNGLKHLVTLQVIAILLGLGIGLFVHLCWCGILMRWVPRVELRESFIGALRLPRRRPWLGRLFDSFFPASPDP